MHQFNARALRLDYSPPPEDACHVLGLQPEDLDLAASVPHSPSLRRPRPQTVRTGASALNPVAASPEIVFPRLNLLNPAVLLLLRLAAHRLHPEEVPCSQEAQFGAF